MECARLRAEDLAKSYDPGPIEDKWYAKWLEDGIFEADPLSGKAPFSIVIPPPNVTGSLHLGHALDCTLQDILCRAKRMQGFNVLWMPGTDHAGIATQNVVERALAGEGKNRHELGREAFVSRVWEWKEEYGSRIIGQLKKLGASCDWRRERFTMDEGLSRAVRRVFVGLYEKDLIYRGKYLINWCPRCLTALSDLEVDHRELDGKLYGVLYKFEGGGGDGITVMTTRPETILGDAAIAVHPRDERNRHLIGNRVVVPLVGRVIPVVEDNMVDPEFGTGAVKITPAHDPNDFLVGTRHGLEFTQVIDGKGAMSKEAGAYAGMGRFEAREAIVRDLGAEGLLAGETEHKHSVGHCYRCGTVIEPYLSEQWFVRTKPLAEADVRAVEAGDISFIPEQWAATYYQWMENIRDWCISRQLWWGHRIPAWYCGDCGGVTVSADDPSECRHCGSKSLRQDEDVLDTWFSSALWPFSTMGWPDDTEELRAFYPTSVLVTGFDIIFFWVARMIMMGLEFMKEPPFRHVYIHALVRDEHGQKMSKSNGNVIDPLVIINSHGADALRFTLAALTLQGRDIFLSESRIETYRYFLNKLWNAARFALMNLDDADIAAEPLEPGTEEHLRLHDRWVLARMSDMSSGMKSLLDGYFFGEAARGMYDFVWGELCDWYIEMSKPALRGDEGPGRRRAAQSVLCCVFKDTLKLLHPIIPFVTEELWEAFAFGREIIGRADWPVPADIPRAFGVKSDMDYIQSIIRSMRNLRAEMKLPPQQMAPMMSLLLKDESKAPLVRENADLMSLMGKVANVELRAPGSPRPPRSIAAVSGDWELSFPVGDLLDVEREVSRLRDEQSKLALEMNRIRGKLGNENFIEKAPPEVVEQTRAAMAELEARSRRLGENIEGLLEA
ncbi:MAG: valine--tRNA ligase [Synergistaceae bacterium]|jgi:valyl-tRNA synthetase|nr:valine--tRNA ligase [Synergistaceae bacterium]